MGFAKGRAARCNYRHNAKKLDVAVHGDDFVIVGPEKMFTWMLDEFGERFVVKAGICGPRKRHEQRTVIP